MFRPGIFLLAGLASFSQAPACIDSPAGEAMEPQTVLLGPWLLEPHAREMTVAWTTRLPLLGQIEFSPEGHPEQVRRSQEGFSSNEHRLVLQGLLPDTRYRYTVLADIPVSGSFTTAPDPNDDPFAHPFSVLVYGDNRSNGGDHELVVRAAESQPAQLALHTGDMVINAKDQRAWAQWFDVERDLLANTPLLPTEGNHEITDNGVTYSRHFQQPGRPTYRSLDYGNVHIQVLDSFEQSAGADPHAGAISEAQKAWAEADAKAVPVDHHLWMLVHQGPHTHPKELRPGHGGLPGVRELIAMVWKVHPVEAIFAGHEHFYERGEIEGLRYFVIGGGGAPLEDPEPAGAGVDVALKELSFVNLQVCGCHVTGKTRDLTGHVLDKFVLADCPKPCGVPMADP